MKKEFIKQRMINTKRRLRLIQLMSLH